MDCWRLDKKERNAFSGIISFPRRRKPRRFQKASVCFRIIAKWLKDGENRCGISMAFTTSNSTANLDILIKHEGKRRTEWSPAALWYLFSDAFSDWLVDWLQQPRSQGLIMAKGESDGKQANNFTSHRATKMWGIRKLLGKIFLQVPTSLCIHHVMGSWHTTFVLKEQWIAVGGRSLRLQEDFSFSLF